MGDLSKIPLNGVYDTETDDVVEHFFIPALSNQITYDRIAGFFSSSSLAVASKGIAELIQNNGHMRLICSPILDRSDVDALEKCVEDPVEYQKIIADQLMKELTEEFFENECSEAMAWMILNGYLEIRLVLVKTPDGRIGTQTDVENSGIFHSKIGIFRDEQDNVVTFSGSINETYSGWVNNIEEFDTFCSWKPGNMEHIEPHIAKFNKYWQVQKRNRSETVFFPDAVKNTWIKIAPKEYKELNILKKKPQQFQLRAYQEEAINNWVENGYRGLFNMATATGKTLTAIYAVKKAMEDIGGKCILIVAVPFQHLIKNPWEDNLNEHLFKEQKDNFIIEAFGDSKRWSAKANSLVPDFKLGMYRSITFVTTYDSFCSDTFQNIIDKFRCKKILIADEVHNAGADNYRKGLREDFDYRLGLSATPARYLDEEGTDFIFRYFEKEVYTFSLKDAIARINPQTGKTFLTPYYYHPIFVSLTDSELEEYSDLSSKIARLVPDPENVDPSKLEQYHLLLLKRARIIKNASEKLKRLTELIPVFNNKGLFDHCLVYCSDGRDQENESLKIIQRVVREMNSNGITAARFTAAETVDERNSILSSFSSGEVSTLVAIKCLDEGVDVPSTRNAIIMASTGNPREYIQRRGRVLRRSEGKEFQIIYDFMVVPLEGRNRQEEIQILQSELRRFKEFVDCSNNIEENKNMIRDLLDIYHIQLGD